MGKRFIDFYSISHLIAGILFQRMDISFKTANLLHIFFEVFENYYWVPKHGGRCIKIPFLPIVDCKTVSDTLINSIGDQLFFIIGLIISQYLFKNSLFFPKWTYLFIPIIPLLLSTIFTNIIGKNPEDEYIKNTQPTHIFV